MPVLLQMAFHKYMYVLQNSGLGTVGASGADTPTYFKDITIILATLYIFSLIFCCMNFKLAISWN